VRAQAPFDLVGAAPDCIDLLVKSWRVQPMNRRRQMAIRRCRYWLATPAGPIPRLFPARGREALKRWVRSGRKVLKVFQNGGASEGFRMPAGARAVDPE
jgi:hypothetical protein